MTGAWWNETDARPGPQGKQPLFSLDVPRDEVVAFAVSTVDDKPAGGLAVLKLTAQLFPLKPGEARVARLEIKRADTWHEVATSVVHYPGWDAHFRVADRKATEAVAYRVRHGERAAFEGLVRADPAGRERITVAVLSCNSFPDAGGAAGTRRRPAGG